MRGVGGGPRTEKGRAVARLNALKHGIASNSPVIPGMEDEAAWRRHRDGIVASLAPEGHLEQVLAERIASLLWRIQRATRYEIVVTMRHIDSAAFDLAVADRYLARADDLVDPEPERVDEAQEARILPSDADLDRSTSSRPSRPAAAASPSTSPASTSARPRHEGWTALGAVRPA